MFKVCKFWRAQKVPSGNRRILLLDKSKSCSSLRPVKLKLDSSKLLPDPQSELCVLMDSCFKLYNPRKELGSIDSNLQFTMFKLTSSWSRWRPWLGRTLSKNKSFSQIIFSFEVISEGTDVKLTLSASPRTFTLHVSESLEEVVSVLSGNQVHCTGPPYLDALEEEAKKNKNTKNHIANFTFRILTVSFWTRSSISLFTKLGAPILILKSTLRLGFTTDRHHSNESCVYSDREITAVRSSSMRAALSTLEIILTAALVECGIYYSWCDASAEQVRTLAG